MNPIGASVFDAYSPQSRAILHLFTYDLVVSAVIFAVVAGLVITAIVRFRHRPGDQEPEQTEGNPRLELVWTVVPFLILVSLFVGTVRTMSIVDPPVRGRTPDVVVIAHQWWWEYRYPTSGVRTANELHLPLGRTWLIEVRSADVIHDFWVPALGAKVDAVPGQANHIWIEPERTGTFWGTCAEFCGNQHALMGLRVVVETPAAFDAWERAQLVVPPQPGEGDALVGARIFRERTCRNCHTIAGTAANATVGPDLTHVADRQAIGAGVLANDPGNLRRWIEHPQRYKPGCLMPDLRLTDDEARQVTAYLESLR